jgi:outer membrane protein assembly factor BamB
MQKSIIVLLLSIIVITQYSCSKDEPITNDDGVIISLQPNWVRSLHKEGTFFSNSIIREHLIHDGNPIVSTTDGENNYYINKIDINTGEDIWRWNDVFSGFTGLIDISYAYIHDDLMWYQFGTRSYTIDLSNGMTVRKERFNDSFDSEISGIKNMVFLRGPFIDTNNYEYQLGYYADLRTGEKNLFLKPNFSHNYALSDGKVGAVSSIVPFVENQDTFLSVVLSEPLPNWYIDSYLGLYNFSKKEWIYDRVETVIPTQANGLSDFPIIYEDKVYANFGNEIVCHNLQTGEQIWKEQFPLDFQFSGFIVKEGRVIANCENQILYCLDADTGSELWTGEGSGTSSRLRYLNGVVYFSGGAPSKIFAVEAATGKTLWRLEASLIEEGAERFKSDFYVIENKKKVVVCTFKNAYCFDAIR